MVRKKEKKVVVGCWLGLGEKKGGFVGERK